MVSCWAVGDNTLFGSMASAVAEEAVETSFTKGVNAVSWVLIRFMMVMVPLVFLINGLTKGDWLGAFLFGISIAVGLTPEMLPMIVTTCLAKGAVSMSRQKTIVKNLNSIQNFGAIDILCTDKTGTLTQDQVVLEYHMDVNGRDDLRVLRHAYLEQLLPDRIQEPDGYRHHPQDRGVPKPKIPVWSDLSEHYVEGRRDSLRLCPPPSDHGRAPTRRQDPDGHQGCSRRNVVHLLVCRVRRSGVAARPCTAAENSAHAVDELNAKGFRVLAIAQKSNPSPVGAFGVKDEWDMVLLGYLAFLDPPKESLPVPFRRCASTA